MSFFPRNSDYTKAPQTYSLFAALCLIVLTQVASAADQLPIADTHVHYSHDSVQLTPPERVIEIMREAQLKFALVSSSDDNGTQLLSNLAPELIVPGLRPYSRRGQLNSWFTDQNNLNYVESLLKKNRYASIGEFHLNGDDALLDIPRRVVELAAEHNLILHAHSDAAAIENLLSLDNTVKVLWAHAGFESPEFVSDMLSRHDRLWVDLAFRSEVGSGGSLTAEWLDLFETHPTRVMLGTDTYTPERMYYLPEHASSSRVWLGTLPDNLAENIAWKNAHELIIPVWNTNRLVDTSAKNDLGVAACQNAIDSGGKTILEEPQTVIHPIGPIKVSEPFDVIVTVCGEHVSSMEVSLDASMPAHGHGMNYSPKHTLIVQSENTAQIRVSDVLLHMPGDWQWSINLRNKGSRHTALLDFKL